MKDIKEEVETARLLGFTVKELKVIKDALYELKQGETLERAGRPISIN